MLRATTNFSLTPMRGSHERRQELCPTPSRWVRTWWAAQQAKWSRAAALPAVGDKVGLWRLAGMAPWSMPTSPVP